MSDRTKRHDGPIHEGAASSSPYPLSRMAPAFDLVDVASEIQRADAMASVATSSKLKVVLDQIRALQEQARVILESSRRDAEIHRARCHFEKRPGKTYHLYRSEDGDTYVSMIAPDEWRTAPKQTFLGSYRLELDMSWTPLNAITERDRDASVIQQLMGAAIEKS